MNNVSYFYCNSCGFEGIDIAVGYSRTTAGGDWYLCPSCGRESNDCTEDVCFDVCFKEE